MSNGQNHKGAMKAFALAILGSVALAGCGKSVSPQRDPQAALAQDPFTRDAAASKENGSRNAKPPVTKIRYERFNFCLAGAGHPLISFDGYVATFKPKVCNVVDYTFTEIKSGGASTYTSAVTSRLDENLEFVLDMRNPTASNVDPYPQLLVDPLSPLVGPLSPRIGLPAYNPNVNTNNYKPGDLAYFEFFTKLLDENDKRRVFESIDALAQTVLTSTKTLLSFAQKDANQPPSPVPGNRVPLQRLKVLQSCSQIQSAWNAPFPQPHQSDGGRPAPGPHANFKIWGLHDGLSGKGPDGRSSEMLIRPDTSIPELCGNPDSWVR